MSVPQTVITRLIKMLKRRGVLIELMGQTYLAEPDADRDEACTRTASVGRGCSSVSWLRHDLSTSPSSLRLRFRHPHAALPELRRRRAEDLRGHAGAAGDPEAPGPPGV
jgi:hypothetical protein